MTAFPLADRAHAPSAPLSPAGTALHDRFTAAVDDDLDLPRALGVVRGILRAAPHPDERRWLVLDADSVLGLDLHRTWDTSDATEELPAAAAPLLRERDIARQSGDYGRADELREELRGLGVEPVDREGGEAGWRRL